MSLKNSNMSKNRGQWAEQYATAFLQQQGLIILNQNYHSRYGEIDIIAQEENCICFVEVKARKIGAMVSALEAVNHRKQQKTIRTAEDFLQKNLQFEQFDCRFDVIAIEYTSLSIIKTCFDDDFLLKNTEYQDLLEKNVFLQWLKYAYTIDG